MPQKLKTPTPALGEFAKLLESGGYLNIPKVGDIVKGKVLSVSKREVRLDLGGVMTGVVRGRELFAEGGFLSELKDGEEVEATVVSLENENGDIELSFRSAGQQRAWDDLRSQFTSGVVLPVKILEANKGGLIVKLNSVSGFLPVSQLSPEHYPRVSGGDKAKILEKLKSYVGSTMDVRVLDINETDGKLIVSEKAVWEEKQKSVLSQFKVGDIVEGEVTALADFGAFLKFSGLEGLIHISELAWQRIDHPSDILKVGQTLKAQIIGLEGSKIFLSIKKLTDDPWKDVAKKYKVGDVVEGTILKINPFGFFVELDPDIHGLAHVSELSKTPVTNPMTVGKPGDRMKFKIVSIEPEEHRLGLSLKALEADDTTSAEAALQA